MARAKLVVLDDSLLRGLAYNTRAVQILPALAKLKPAATGGSCTPCAAKRNKAQAANRMAAVKAQIATLSGQPLANLKDLLNAESVRVVTKAGPVTR